MNDSSPGTPESARPALEGPRSPLRVMQALEALAASRDGLSLARLSEQMKTPKSSLLSLLRSLEAGGYVVQGGGAYRLGAGAIGLGARIAGRIAAEPSVPAALRPSLSALMAASGETALLGVLGDDGRHGVYVDIVEGRGPVRFSAGVGTRRPLFCSAIGKVMLAFQPAEAIERYLDDTPLVLPNGGQRLARDEVLARLQRIRATGLSTSFEEIVDGAGGVAAPVFGRDGTLVAALSVAAPIGRLRLNEARLAALVHEAARRASQAFGHGGRYPGAD